MNSKLFLVASKAVINQITDIFDFVWPTAAAMWNLRWQVDGYVRAHVDTSDVELNGRFVAGSDITGANLRRACITTSWATQQEAFARFLLIDLCALYESWADGALHELQITRPDGKALQFPNKRGGLPDYIQNISKSQSNVMYSCLYPSLITHRKNSLSFINELLICYRYFKECRNCIVHNNGHPSSTAVDAYNAYSSLTAASLGVSEVPAHEPITPSQRIRLKLRGVVGFAEVVLRLVATFDAELTRSKYAEQLFIQRWKTSHRPKRLLPAKPAERHDTIKRLVMRLGLPGPKAVSELEEFLKKETLVLF